MRLRFTSLSVLAALTAWIGVASASAPKAPPSSPELLEKGKASYNMNCAACHGEKGAGDGAAAAALNPKPRSFVTDTFKNGEKLENVFKSTSEGLPGTVMVAFAHLPEEERWAISHYVLELRKAAKAKPKK